MYFHVDVERDYGDRYAEVTPPAADQRALERFDEAESDLIDARSEQSARRRALIDRR